MQNANGDSILVVMVEIEIIHHHTKTCFRKKIWLLLFTLWVGAGFLRVEICVVFTSAAIIVIIIFVLLILIIITLLVQSLPSEEEHGPGHNSLSNVVTNLKIYLEQSLQN